MALYLLLKEISSLPEDLSVGYVFTYQGKAVDLETIYELSGLKGKSNVIKREFLVNPELYLYLDDPRLSRLL